MFIVMNKIGKIKSKGIVNENYERLYADKVKYTSPVPNCYILKYLYVTTMKKERDIVLVTVPGFFL